MKIFTSIGIILMSLSTGFTNVINGQEYTYLLQVDSPIEQVQFFDLEIRSKIGSSSKANTIILSAQTTPFMRILPAGEHVMIIEHLGGEGRLVSKVTGFIDGEAGGSALGDDRKTILMAGPNGRYSAGK